MLRLPFRLTGRRTGHCFTGKTKSYSRAVEQSCSRAVVQSISQSVMQFCGYAVLKYNGYELPADRVKGLWAIVFLPVLNSYRIFPALLTFIFKFLIVNCSLFIVHCSSFIVHCSLFIVHCSLSLVTSSATSPAMAVNSV
jgi:hypothetical protein